MSRTATVQAQQRWEYMEITRQTEGYLVNDLNELGDVGWDVISVTYHKAAKSGLGESMCWTAFLKRPHAAHQPTATAAPSRETKASETAESSRGPNSRKISASESTEEFTVAEAEYVVPEVDEEKFEVVE